MTLPMLSQLRCFLPKSVSLYRPQQLYAKAPSNTANDLVEAASSWQGPSVLLVSASTPYRLNTVHLKALKDSRVDTETSVFGVFISQPWQTAPGTCFVSTGSLLCQLAPIHEVFPAAEHGKKMQCLHKRGILCLERRLGEGFPLIMSWQKATSLVSSRSRGAMNTTLGWDKVFSLRLSFPSLPWRFGA